MTNNNNCDGSNNNTAEKEPKVLDVVKYSKMLLPLSIVQQSRGGGGGGVPLYDSPASRSPHQPSTQPSLTRNIRRLFMLLCILALVCALKMHSQIINSIEKLRKHGNDETLATVPTVVSNNAAKKNQTIHNNHPKTAATAVAATAAKRNLNIKATKALPKKKDNSISPPRVSLINITKYTTFNTNVPFVYMVFKRVDYLQRAMESLNQSDYPKDRLPLIISHDGHVPEVVDYVENIVRKHFNVIQLFHPYSCYEHPDSFPGNDTKLNEGYTGGDWYGNTRSHWATCCKHHFTWMINQVFQMHNFTDNKRNNNPLHVDTFFFTEEDYLVAPNVYSAIIAGMNVMDSVNDMAPGGFIGLGLDPTNNGIKKTTQTATAAARRERLAAQALYSGYNQTDAPWKADTFRTGPMTLNRDMFAKIKDNVHAHYAYCTFDDYNWDWSMEHLTRKGYLPFTILMSGGKLVQHIGNSEGMHSNNIKNRTKTLQDEALFISQNMNNNNNTTSWTVNQRVLVNVTVAPPKKIVLGNGGWGHAADHAHCLSLFQW